MEKPPCAAAWQLVPPDAHGLEQGMGCAWCIAHKHSSCKGWSKSYHEPSQQPAPSTTTCWGELLGFSLNSWVLQLPWQIAAWDVEMQLKPTEQLSASIASSE